MCATIIASTFASTIFLNGTNSVVHNLVESLGISAKDECESVLVSPCPGKCLAVASMPPA